MRVGVIRGDLTQGPIFIADLEPTSQHNNPVDPVAQTRYIQRPSVALVTAAMAPIPAAFESTGNIVLPLAVVAGVSDTIILDTGNGAGPLTAVIAPNAGYTTMALLIAAVNAAFVAAGSDAIAEVGILPLRIRFKTSTVTGPGSTITVTSVVGGSTAGTGLVMVAGGTFTVPTVLATIASMNPTVTPPATGSVNVSLAKMLLVSKALQTGTTVNAMGVALADTIAPHFVETDVAIKSFQVGDLAGFRSLTYVPDPRALPAIAAGPAIEVVQDDGVTAFSALGAAAMPMITAAVHNVPNAGDITITGVGMAYTERDNTTVDVVDATTGAKVRLTQSLITSTIADAVLLTGTFNVVNGSAAVLTSLNQVGLLLPGNSVVFGAQPNVIYDVSTVTATTVTLTAPYTGISNPLSTAKTPITQGVVTPTSIVIPSDLLVPVGSTTSLGAAAGALVSLQFTSYDNGNYGTAVTVASVTDAGVATLTGLARMTTYSVGKRLTLSGGASPGNNGTFFIVARVSATSVKIQNINADAADANNGAAGFIWNEVPPVVFVTT
jgi:hypothetical protein